ARRKLERTFLCIPPDLPSIYCDNFAVFPRALQAQLLTPATKEQVAGADPYRVMREHLERTDAGTLLDRLLYVDIKTYLHERVLGERARRRGIFKPDVVRRLVGEHVSGRVEHMERLWALVNFELWLRRFVDGEEDVRMPQAPAVAHARVAG